MNLINPIAARELRDVLRSRRSVVCLTLYLTLLSLAVAFAWPRSAELLVLSDRIGLKVFETFALCQILLVALMAPIFSAGSLTREKEEDTLEILMASPLTPAQIIGGKVSASLMFLLLIVASSLPVLTAAISLGGFGISEVLSLYFSLGSIAVVVTYVGLVCSAWFPRTHSALVVSLMITLVLLGVVLGLPIAWYGVSEALGRRTKALFFMAILAHAIVRQLIVTRIQGDFLKSPPPAHDEDTDGQSGLVLDPEAFPDRMFFPAKTEEGIADSDNPVYQKELRSELAGAGSLFVRLVIQGSLALSVFMMPALVTGSTGTFAAYVATVLLLVTPSLACGAFSQERERDTLEPLMLTMLTPREIVWGKLRAMVRYSLALGVVFLATFAAPWVMSCTGTNFFGKVGTGLSHVLVVGSSAMSAACLASLFSLVTLRTVTATVLTYAALLLIHGAPFVVHQLVVLFTSCSAEAAAWVLSPSVFAPLLLAPPTASLLDGPSLWHGFVALSALQCMLVAAYLVRCLRAHAIPDSRASR